MANEINGVLCLVKAGTFALPTEILGQGTMSIEHGGDPILIDNKSSGEWQTVLDGGSTTRSLNPTVEFDHNSDAGYKALLTAARNKTAGDYVFVMGSAADGYYYEGNFVPSIASETANKNEIVKISILFTSNGVITNAEQTT